MLIGVQICENDPSLGSAGSLVFLDLTPDSINYLSGVTILTCARRSDESRAPISIDRETNVLCTPSTLYTTTTQVDTNESYVSVLNHCFDDIEKFIIRLQSAYAALRDLQAQKKQTRRSSMAQNGASMPLPPTPLTAPELAMLSAQARGPSADDFYEILSKFKLAFNLLAKLKGCIHEPNAPELVHFLFTPLAIIIESARNGK